MIRYLLMNVLGVSPAVDHQDDKDVGAEDTRRQEKNEGRLENRADANVSRKRFGTTEIVDERRQQISCFAFHPSVYYRLIATYV